MAEDEAGLTMLAEKTLQTAILPNLLAYCPTMDLLALATADEHVHVFRLNGQKVFGVSKIGSAGEIADLTWKPNGRDFFPTLTSSFESLTMGYGRPVTCCCFWEHVVHSQRSHRQDHVQERIVDFIQGPHQLLRMGVQLHRYLGR